MSYTTKSPLTKTGNHYSADQLWQAFEPMTPPDQRDRVRQALRTIATVAPQLGLDEIVACAIAWIETGAAGTGLPWRSSWWLNGNNLGNLGITGDPKQNAAAQKWATPADGAMALLAHIVAYAYGSHWRDAWDMDALGDPRVWDKRFDLVLATTDGKPMNSLEALNNRWAVDVDRNYHGKLANRANILVAAIKDPPVTTPATPAEPVEQEKPMARVYGKVPKPKFVWAPVYKRAGSGYNQLSAARKLVGVAFHEWMGVSSLAFHKQFFACSSPGVCPSGYTCYPGERCADALVDGFVMKDGTMVLINDPWGTRAPWASGGSGPYEGDGAAFASVFGSAGFNSRLFSVEVVKLTNENYTAAQIQTLGEWSAYIHDQDGQDWDEHPYTSKYKCVTDILHYEASAGTSCGRNELDDVTKVQAVAKQIMRSYQEQITVPGPIQPEVPTLPDPPLPGNADANKAAAAFGSLRRVNTINDSVSSGHTYDPKGPISLEYTRQCVAAYGLDYSKWPAGEDWVVMNDSGKTLQIITFSNDWRLVSAAERAGWALMDFKEIDGAAA